ncbi:MAG: AAA family ATPase, partial [Bacteroidia bacterium]
MLTRFIILNSKVFGKAEVRLNDCDSLQLVGPNNIGKSTLIYALNFLFVVDGNKMTFSGHRKGDKETLHHYFPNHNQSYIVFEVFKKSYYCILVKRDAESNLEYFKFDTEYRDDFFTGEDKRLLKFDEVQEKIVKEGIEFTQFRDRREVFNFIYQRGRRNNGVVWLEDTVRSEGLSNNFSRIYRYLINTKLITNKNLKEALIVADNRENETLNFSQKNKKDIADLMKVNREIRNIRSVKDEFGEFRESVNQYNAKARIISQLYQGFNTTYEGTMPQLQTQLLEKDMNIAKLKTEMNEDFIPQKAELDRKIGGKDAEMQANVKLLHEKETELKTINEFEPENLLKEKLSNLDEKRKKVESRITMVEVQKLGSNQLEHRIDSLKEQVARFDTQIKNYNDLLINKISGTIENRKLLNSILSDQVMSLPGEQVLKKIKKITDTLNIFDGEIDISKNIVLKDFKSVEEIKKEWEAAKLELKNFESLLIVVKDIEKSKTELSVIQEEMEGIKIMLARIASKPALIKAIEKLKATINSLSAEKDKYENEQKQISKKIAKLSNDLQEIVEDKKKREDRVKQIMDFKHELDEFNITPEPYETSESLDQLYNKIMLNQRDRTMLKINKDIHFDKLREKLQSTFADETDFISYVEEEIALVEDKERSIQSLLESISTQFANPAYTLLKRYEEFKEFVYNKFNHKLSQTRISDIESLKIELIDNKKLVDEVRKISQIQTIKGQLMFEFDTSENLKVLNSYLDSGKQIAFDDLFDITLHITKKGTSKQVDLGEQIESDGTDKMIRLVIIMNII